MVEIIANKRLVTTGRWSQGVVKCKQNATETPKQTNNANLLVILIFCLRIGYYEYLLYLPFTFPLYNTGEVRLERPVIVTYILLFENWGELFELVWKIFAIGPFGWNYVCSKIEILRQPPHLIGILGFSIICMNTAGCCLFIYIHSTFC